MPLDRYPSLDRWPSLALAHDLQSLWIHALEDHQYLGSIDRRRRRRTICSSSELKLALTCSIARPLPFKQFPLPCSHRFKPLLLHPFFCRKCIGSQSRSLSALPPAGSPWRALPATGSLPHKQANHCTSSSPSAVRIASVSMRLRLISRFLSRIGPGAGTCWFAPNICSSRPQSALSIRESSAPIAESNGASVAIQANIPPRTLSTQTRPTSTTSATNHS